MDVPNLSTGVGGGIGAVTGGWIIKLLLGRNLRQQELLRKSQDERIAKLEKALGEASAVKADIKDLHHYLAMIQKDVHLVVKRLDDVSAHNDKIIRLETKIESQESDMKRLSREIEHIQNQCGRCTLQ